MLDNITFDRIALTPEQVEQYNLPENPEVKREGSELHKKLHKDPRGKKFKEKYGRLVQFEVDALFGSKPDVFTNLVIDAIDQYFDWDIYQQEVLDKEERSVQNLTELLRVKVQDMKVVDSGDNE